MKPTCWIAPILSNSWNRKMQKPRLSLHTDKSDKQHLGSGVHLLENVFCCSPKHGRSPCSQPDSEEPVRIWPSAVKQADGFRPILQATSYASSSTPTFNQAIICELFQARKNPVRPDLEKKRNTATDCKSQAPRPSLILSGADQKVQKKRN